MTLRSVLVRFAPLVAVALVAPACSGPLVNDAPVVVTPTGFPNHSVQQIRDAVRLSAGTVRTLKSDGKVRISSPRLNQDASFSLRATLGDSVTVVLRGPFGIEGGRAVATPDSFLAADRLNRRLLVGPASAAERYLPGAGSTERVARAATGLLIPGAGVTWQLGTTPTAYTLRGVLQGGTEREYTVDPALWRVTRVREFDVAGTLVGEQTAEAFDTVGGVVIPRRVTLTAGETTVELEHRSVELNGALRHLWRRPDGYEVIPIR